MGSTYIHDTWWLVSRTPGRGIVDTSEGVVGCHLVVVHLFCSCSAGFPPVLVWFTGSFHFHLQTCLRSWLTFSLSSSCLLSLLWVSSWRTPAFFLLWGCLAGCSIALLLALWSGRKYLRGPGYLDQIKSSNIEGKVAILCFNDAKLGYCFMKINSV